MARHALVGITRRCCSRIKLEVSANELNRQACVTRRLRAVVGALFARPVYSQNGLTRRPSRSSPCSSTCNGPKVVRIMSFFFRGCARCPRPESRPLSFQRWIGTRLLGTRALWNPSCSSPLIPLHRLCSQGRGASSSSRFLSQAQQRLDLSSFCPTGDQSRRNWGSCVLSLRRPG